MNPDPLKRRWIHPNLHTSLLFVSNVYVRLWQLQEGPMGAKAHIYWEVAGDGAVQKSLTGNNSYAYAGVVSKD